MADYKRIGEVLLARGRITPAQLQTAIQARRLSHQRIGQLLINMGFVTELDVAKGLAEQFGFDLVDPMRKKPSRQALELLDSHLALTHRILPLKYNDDCVECIMADPIDFPTTDMISRISGKRIVVYVAPGSALTNAIIDAYGITGGAGKTKTQSTPRPQLDRSAILQQLEEFETSATGGAL